MDKLWRVGLFANDRSYFNYAFDFVNKLIKDKDEKIIQIKDMFNTFEIETDKSLYKFIEVHEGIRGYRWHEAYIFDSWTMSKEMIDGLILAKIVQYDIWDKDARWDYKKYVHFMERN